MRHVLAARSIAARAGMGKSRGPSPRFSPRPGSGSAPRCSRSWYLWASAAIR